MFPAPPRSRREDWGNIYGHLMREHGCTPSYLNSLTLNELCLYFSEREEFDPYTAEELRQCFLRLTPEQRIELGQRKLRLL